MPKLPIAATLISALLTATGHAQTDANFSPGRNFRGNDDVRHGPPGVYDAHGRYIGKLETNSGQDGVFLSIDGAVTFAGIARQSVGTQTSATQFEWASVGYIAYPSSDCSGAPVLEYFYGPRPSMAVRQGADVVLYVAGTANSATVHVASVRQNPTLSVCSPLSQDLKNVFVPETTYPLTQDYPEPLSIRY